MPAKIFRHIFSLLLITFFGIIDSFLDPQFRTSFLYIIPIALMAWTNGLKSGLFYSVVAAATWVAINVFFHSDVTNIMAVYWNTLCIYVYYFLVAYLVAKVRHQTLLLQSLASTDSLTKTLNRRAFYQRLEEEIKRSRRYGQTFSVAFLDLDDFKSINDTYGHEDGDKLLQTLTEAIKSTIRTTDKLGRIGGDEFAILLPETRQDQARIVMNNILQKGFSNLKYKGKKVNFSAGVITCHNPASGVDEIMLHLDRLMYEAKKRGKGLINYATIP